MRICGSQPWPPPPAHPLSLWATLLFGLGKTVRECRLLTGHVSLPTRNRGTEADVSRGCTRRVFGCGVSGFALAWIQLMCPVTRRASAAAVVFLALSSCHCLQGLGQRLFRESAGMDRHSLRFSNIFP